MSKAIIFGANGQDGHYLSLLCRDRGITPIGVGRSSQRGIADFAQVESLICEHNPEYIFHLAANSTTHHSALFENHQTISTGTFNILEAVRLHAPYARVFLAGSGLQFKNTGAPISENDPFEATNSYAVSRIHSVYAGRYFRSLDLKVYVGYLFHHESPLRKAGHVSQQIASFVRNLSPDGNEVLELGDLTVSKEWTFAGDIARGILCLVEQDAIFEAAIGSGKTYTIGEWAECCFSAVGRDWQKHVSQKKGFVAEYPKLVSDPRTMNSLGWRPEVDISDLAKLMVHAVPVKLNDC